jgi:hypothetical protein
VRSASISISIFLSGAPARSSCPCAFKKYQLQGTKPCTSELQLCTWDRYFRQRHTAATSRTTHMPPPADAPTATPTGADADGAAAAAVGAPDTDFVGKFERTSSVKEARCMVGVRQNFKRPNPFRSGIAIDPTTWSFRISSYHLLRGRLLATFSSPPLGCAVTSFCRATRPFYLLIRSVRNAKLFRVNCKRPSVLNFRRYRGFDRSAIATGAAAALVHHFLCGKQAASSKQEAPGMTTRHTLELHCSMLNLRKYK